MQKLKNDLIHYQTVFTELEELKIIERLTGKGEKRYFLPHRPVVKMDSATTKIKAFLMRPLERTENVP